MNDKIETKNPTENLEEQANHPQENLEINASQLEQSKEDETKEEEEVKQEEKEETSKSETEETDTKEEVLQKQEEEPKPETKEVETVLATEEQTNSIPIQETKEENVEENVRVEGSPNKDFFQQTIKANVSEEIIKEKIGDLNDDWKDDRIEPVLQANDEQKIKLYDELEVKNLPKNWKEKLLRLKHLERNEKDYLQKKEDLKSWTDAFTEQNPLEVQEQIRELEEKQTDTEKELEGWKNTFVEQLPQQVKEERDDWLEKYEEVRDELKEWQQTFPNQVPSEVQKKINELEVSLEEWNQSWEGQDLEAIKKEWEELRKRPDLSVSETEFYDDYARRLTIAKGKLLSDELTKEKEKVAECQEEIQKLTETIDIYLKLAKIRKYVLSKPVLTKRDAQVAIAELLEKTEKEWTNYLEGDLEDNLGEKRIELGLSWKDEKDRQNAYQILSYIREARETLEYQKLFERWSGIVECDKDSDLNLLKEYLEVKDEEEVENQEED